MNGYNCFLQANITKRQVIDLTVSPEKGKVIKSGENNQWSF